MKIKDIMTKDCNWGARHMNCTEAAQIMKQHDFGFLPVGCTEKNKLVGTVTDRDIVVKCLGEGKAPQDTTLEDIMNEAVYYCYDDQSVQEVCDNMAELRIKRMPVVNRDKELLGVVSFGDVAQAAQDHEVGQTQQKITKECAEHMQAA